MSSPDSDRFLKIASIVAVVALAAGAFLYLRTMFGTDDAEPATTPTVMEGKRLAPIRAGVSTPPPAPASTPAGVVPAERGEAPPAPRASAGAQFAPLTATILETLTRPKVVPDTQFGSVETELELALPAVERCWSEAVGDKRRDSQVNVHFKVDENGEPTGLTTRTKRVGVASVNACFADAVRERVFGDTEPGTTVYWPILLDPELGPQLR